MTNTQEPILHQLGHEPDSSALCRTSDIPQTESRQRVAPRAGETELQFLSEKYARSRDPEARDALILYHQKLVHYVATRFVGGGETLEDLVQVGNIGLINALDRFDPSKEVKFSTYAMPTILGEIKRHFRDKTWQVKVPRWLQELSLNVKKAQESLTVKLGRAPTYHELAELLQTSEERIIEACEISRVANTVSLDRQLESSSGGDTPALSEIIGRLDRGLYDIDAFSDLRRALCGLEERERQVIEMRFFDEISQSKIACELNISQMHVSRLQTKALSRLRDILNDEVKKAGRKPGVSRQNSDVKSKKT